MTDPSARRLIVNADDFGVDPAVNQAVETAYTDGILTSASLMMGGAALDDAVERAKRLKGLAVGLHITVADGVPVLPPERIPSLVGPDGRFRDGLFKVGVRWFFSAEARKQLAAEIDAQFQAFLRTGLLFDHVNVHKHLHLHPTVGATVVSIARRYGVRAIRIPYEPRKPLLQAEPGTKLPRAFPNFVLTPLKRNAQRAHMVTNDSVFGLAWSGAMTEARILSLIPHLPDGTSELYSHPAAADGAAMPHAAPGYLYREELAALTSPAVKAAIAEAGIPLISYSGGLKPLQ